MAYNKTTKVVDTQFTNSIHASSLVFLLLPDNTWILSGPGGSITDFYCRQPLNTNPQMIIDISTPVYCHSLYCTMNYFFTKSLVHILWTILFFQKYISMSSTFTYFLHISSFFITLKISIFISRFIIKWRIAEWKWNFLDKSFKKKSIDWWVKNPPGVLV